MAILALNAKIWITLGPILLINILLLISLFAYTFTKKARTRDIPESATRHSSKFLGRHFKEWWVFITDPIALFFVKIGLKPSILTLIGFLFSVVATIFFAKGLFGYAGWAMIFGATFDIFDGRVARLTNSVSRSGGFFDSVMDRFGEGICFLGLAFYFRNSWILFFIIAGLVGSMLVSYTRARGEAVNVVCKSGSMQRPERIVYLGVASVLEPVTSIILMQWFPSPLPILVIGAIIIIGIMTNVTAIHRMIFIMNALDTMDKSEKETIPQILTKLSTREGRKELLTKAKYGYDRSKASYDHVILFLINGINASFLKDLFKKGELPNIQRYLLDSGCMMELTGAFPSTTGPALTPFITGCFPGTCNLPGARWFDREVPPSKVLTMNRFRDYIGWGAYIMDHDLSGSVNTIFEYSKSAVNIFGMLNRGCGIIRDPAFFRLHSLYHNKKTFDAKELENAAFEWLEDAIRKKSDFIFYTFPSLNIHNANEEKIDALRRFDETIASTVSILKQRGIFDKTVLFIASDHSKDIAYNQFDLVEFLETKLPTLKYPEMLKDWNNKKAIPLLSGSSAAHLYLKQHDDWSSTYQFERLEKTGLVSSLLDQKAIDLVAGKSEDEGIIVVSQKGRARILETTHGHISYNIVDSDPFGFNNVPSMLSFKDAVELSIGSQYPDCIVQILQQFRSLRSGDIIISASKGYSLAKTDQTTLLDGSLLRENMLVPFISNIAIPGDIRRTVDIFSTILNILGISATHRIDGLQLNRFLNYRGKKESL